MLFYGWPHLAVFYMCTLKIFVLICGDILPLNTSICLCTFPTICIIPCLLYAMHLFGFWKYGSKDTAVVFMEFTYWQELGNNWCHLRLILFFHSLLQLGGVQKLWVLWVRLSLPWLLCFVVRSGEEPPSSTSPAVSLRLLPSPALNLTTLTSVSFSSVSHSHYKKARIPERCSESSFSWFCGQWDNLLLPLPFPCFIFHHRIHIHLI